MANESFSAYRTRITQIVCGLVFMGAVMLALRSLMAGAVGTAVLVLALALGGAIVFALDDKYWIVLPFLSTANLALPRLPFNGTELGCVVLIGVHFVRLALKKGGAFRFDWDLLVTLPVLGWMFVVWMLNPVGLAMFGSSTIGGRFYFDIVVGAGALFVLSTIRVSESDAKLLFVALLFGMLWSLFHGVVFPGVDPSAVIFTGGTPERSTRYTFVVCASIFILLFSYWPLSSILASPIRILLFAIMSMLVIYSGKRRALGTIALVPFFRMILTGRERLLTIVVSVLASVVLVFSVAGDGTLYQLPNSARRALAIVSPRYQRHGDGGLSDIFRREMREEARFVIRENPWFGRKGFAMNLNETSWINFGGGLTSMFAGHAYAGNWHSAWYAYAADFGLPCVLFWFFVQVHVLIYAIHACRLVQMGRFFPACCLYYSLSLFIDAAFSYTSGHSAHTTMFTFIMYGMLLAIVRGYKEQYGFDKT